jgi:AraC-like DNA-binding protein
VTSSVYRERPAGPESGLACTWTQSPPPGAGPYVQRVVPDGCMDVIWPQRTGELLVAGPDTAPHLARMVPGEYVVAVRFRPGTAPPVLGLPADAVRDVRVPLRLLWGSAADALAETLAAAADPETTLQQRVLEYLRSAPPPDPAVPAMIAALGASCSVRETADRLGLSERQLRRRSLSACGYGPKTLQRILRFQLALTLARRNEPYAAVAQLAGYSDQPHLAHEVRELAGVSLTELVDG